MRARLGLATIFALFGIASLGLTVVSAGMALRVAKTSVLHTDTRSLMRADYSADARGETIEPLSPAIIDASSRDDRSIERTPAAPRRVGIVFLPSGDAPQSPGPSSAAPLARVRRQPRPQAARP